MRTGSVKWFNNAKGYGFIQTDEHDEDIFVHYSQINDEGFKTLKAGETVDFELCRGPKGLHAEDVYREKDREEAQAEDSQDAQVEAEGSDEKLTDEGEDTDRTPTEYATN